jgi:glutamine cyclotransferase
MAMAANRFLKIGIPAVVILVAVASGFAWRHFKTGNVSKTWTYKIVNIFHHDQKAFTQGLVFENGVLYEGTGIEGHSELRKVELETGNVLQRVKLPDQYFGEGVTIFKDQIIQLTYQSKVGFVYDKDSFELLREFTYPTEGWGITHDGTHLIMSDGTPMLYFLDPETLKQINRMMVLEQDRPVWGLNELEYVNGEIYANVWPTDRIVRIEPETGKVVGWIDMKGLLPPEDRSEEIDVFNGIAYDPDNQRLFMTGKYWPKLFEIKLIPAK